MGLLYAWILMCTYSICNKHFITHSTRMGVWTRERKGRERSCLIYHVSCKLWNGSSDTAIPFRINQDDELHERLPYILKKKSYLLFFQFLCCALIWKH